MTDTEYPLIAFRFQVEFLGYPLRKGASAKAVPICAGSFSDCTGLEATMEPKVIKSGGANYGPAQRCGPVTFATVILKRGMTTKRDLWNWFSKVNEQAKYAVRFDVTIKVGDPDEKFTKPVWSVQLKRALPIKFKAADLNARGQEVGIEELHLAHEGLTFL
ncbi:MAG TPA: phage tail protein [Verrucomicrobiota bacterium]|nr:phage tail protein [Verrucomicrobiales bacterium]HRI13129.1 phage tail protein [Verrucomicrobiota bacterium]